MIPGINPKIDCAFKRLFGHEQNRRLTVSLLNAVLEGTGRPPIVDVELIDPHGGKDAINDKLSIVDVRVKASDGRRYIIEMQMLTHRDLAKRLLYYWAKGYSAQIGNAETYSELQPTILICFLDEPLFKSPTPYHQRFHLTSAETGLIFAEDIELHTIELPKLAAIEDSSLLDRWALFLNEAEHFDPENLPSVLQMPDFKQAMEVLKMIRENEGTWLEYDAQRLREMDERTRMQQSREEGLEQGLEQGRVEGREEGRQEGRVEGREEGRQLGSLMGRIRTLQEILQIPVSSEDALSHQSFEELQRQADELAARLRQRGS